MALPPVPIYNPVAYLGGGRCAMPPPLWVARIVYNSHRIVCKSAEWPPLSNLGRKFEHTNGQNLGEDFYFEPKTGLNLSEYCCFFFWSSPNFGQEDGLILSGEIFLLVFIILKFSAPPPPLPKILRTLLIQSLEYNQGIHSYTLSCSFLMY